MRYIVEYELPNKHWIEANPIFENKKDANKWIKAEPRLKDTNIRIKKNKL